MKVEYVPQTNDDLSVANTARVSFAKVVDEMTDKDAGLIRYLAKHNHWTPFAHQRFTFECPWGGRLLYMEPTDPLLTAGMVHNSDYSKVRHSFYGWVQLLKAGSVVPAFIDSIVGALRDDMPVSCDAYNLPSLTRRNLARLVTEENDPRFIDVTLRMSAPVPIRTQCFKHKMGFVENEESRRYISSRPELFVPDAFRVAADSVKQGSGGVHPDNDEWLIYYNANAQSMIAMYEVMIDEGVCPEQARFILPQGCIVNWIWTGNLQSYARFYNQRTDPHAQKEVRDLAAMVGSIVGELYPDSWAALTQNEEETT